MPQVQTSKLPVNYLEVLKYVETHVRSSLPSGKITTTKRNKKTVPSPIPPTPPTHAETPIEGGCKMCGKDNDHSRLLLCETCDAECHTYCLVPPLHSVPKDAWYCDGCRCEEGDGLERLVSGLPSEYTRRFGEIVWANGGNGFGWWPACIYDPRLTIGGARQQALKTLGKRHLIYYINCEDAPFDVLDAKKIMPWYDGFAYDYHLGKMAKSHSKKRYHSFLSAFQAATIEEAKPIAQRFDWKHEGENNLLLSPHKEEAGVSGNAAHLVGSKRDSEKSSTLSVGSQPQKKRTRQGKKPVAAQHLQFDRNSNSSASSPVELLELFCRIVRIQTPSIPSPDKIIGFIKLDSRESTFEDARVAIEKDLVPEELDTDFNWRFHIDTLGPVSRKQESSLGPILKLVRNHSDSCDGSIVHPICLKITEWKTPNV